MLCEMPWSVPLHYTVYNMPEYGFCLNRIYSTESTISFLYRKTWVRESLYSCIFLHCLMSEEKNFCIQISWGLLILCNLLDKTEKRKLNSLDNVWCNALKNIVKNDVTFPTRFYSLCESVIMDFGRHMFFVFIRSFYWDF